MGKLVLAVASKVDDLFYVHVAAESPAFAAKGSFYCKSKSLIDFGKKIKGFPHSGMEKNEIALGEARKKTEFHFRTVDSTGLCELWVRIRGTEDEHGQGAEAYFPIDYLEPSAIDAFATDLVKLGTGHSKSAEIKNKFETHK